MQTKDKINFSEYLKIEENLDVRVGKVISATRIPKKDKLLLLEVSFQNNDVLVSAVTNLGGTYEPQYFEGKSFPFIVNLEPSIIGGIESEVMILTHMNFEFNY